MFFKTNKSKNKAFLETRTFFTVKLNMKGDGRTIFEFFQIAKKKFRETTLETLEKEVFVQRKVYFCARTRLKKTKRKKKQKGEEKLKGVQR